MEPWSSWLRRYGDIVEIADSNSAGPIKHDVVTMRTMEEQVAECNQCKDKDKCPTKEHMPYCCKIKTLQEIYDEPLRPSVMFIPQEVFDEFVEFAKEDQNENISTN